VPCVAATLAAAAAPAAAHALQAGVDPFVAGLLHPLLVPGHTLALLALGLWLGQQGTAVALRALGLFGAAVATGLALALWSDVGVPGERALLVAGLALALAAVLERPRPAVARMAAARVRASRRAGGGIVPGAALGVALTLTVTCAVALGIALDSLPERGGPAAERWMQAASTAVGAVAVVLVPAALSALAAGRRSRWPRVGVRVVASWLAAAALLALVLDIVAPVPASRASARAEPDRRGQVQSASFTVSLAVRGSAGCTCRSATGAASAGNLDS
jgi:urease accessory protein